MRDYIKMIVLRDLGNTMDLVSEVIDEETEAEYFAKCFAHNYNCVTNVRKAKNEDGYVVFADNVAIYLIRVNISPKSDEGMFANWEFEGRHFHEPILPT